MQSPPFWQGAASHASPARTVYRGNWQDGTRLNSTTSTNRTRTIFQRITGNGLTTAEEKGLSHISLRSSLHLAHSQVVDLKKTSAQACGPCAPYTRLALPAMSLPHWVSESVEIVGAREREKKQLQSIAEGVTERPTPSLNVERIERRVGSKAPSSSSTGATRTRALPWWTRTWRQRPVSRRAHRPRGSCRWDPPTRHGRRPALHRSGAFRCGRLPR